MSEQTHPKEKQRKAKGIAKKKDCEARSSKMGKGQTDKQPLSSRRIEEESKNKREKKGRVLQQCKSQPQLMDLEEVQMPQEGQEENKEKNNQDKKQNSTQMLNKTESISLEEKESKPRKLIFEVSSRLLAAKIKPKHRFKLFDWFAETCAANVVNRHSFALGQHLFDLVSINSREPLKETNIHLTGIACLSVAIKFEDFRRTLNFCDEITKDEVLKTEQEILLLLQFRVMQRTYFTVLDEMVDSFDDFVRSLPKDIPSYLIYRDGDFRTAKKIIALYDRAILIKSVTFSLQFSSVDFATNILYLDIFYQLKREDRIQFNQEGLENISQQNKIIQIFQYEKLQRLFTRFLQYCQQKEKEAGQIKLEICRYLSQFFKIKSLKTIINDNRLTYEQNILLMRKNTNAFRQAHKILCKETERKQRESNG